MTAFIRQEAMEKANEIRLKADEEFAIEKSKLVRQETASIDSSYEKKFKQASMSQQITRSTVANKSRLRILSARQELLNRLFEDASKKLGEVSKDKAKYQGIMKNFILEGAYALSEDKLQASIDSTIGKLSHKKGRMSYAGDPDAAIDAAAWTPDSPGPPGLMTSEPIFWPVALMRSIAIWATSPCT